MTVSELIKALNGVPGNLPVYIADHDHGDYETGGKASFVDVKDQSEADEEGKAYLNSKQGNAFKIKGKYLVIKS